MPNDDGTPTEQEHNDVIEQMKEMLTRPGYGGQVIDMDKAMGSSEEFVAELGLVIATFVQTSYINVSDLLGLSEYLHDEAERAEGAAQEAGEGRPMLDALVLAMLASISQWLFLATSAKIAMDADAGPDLN